DAGTNDTFAVYDSTCTTQKTNFGTVTLGGNYVATTTTFAAATTTVTRTANTITFTLGAPTGTINTVATPSTMTLTANNGGWCIDYAYNNCTTTAATESGSADTDF